MKTFKLGTMGIASIVILILIVATLNVGTVDTVAVNSTSNKKTSDLKWVTKYIKGVGDVTAREDMFVGEGDNIRIKINKDYKEIGVITPVIKNAPEPDIVTVDTPYGKVVTSRNYYEKVGKEQIIAEQKAFKEEREQLIKKGILNNSTESTNYFQAAPQTHTSLLYKPKAMSTYISTAGDRNFVMEYWKFNHYSGRFADGVLGTITPAATSPLPPDNPWVTSYQELEIHLNDDDIFEFISEHYSGGKKVWGMLYHGPYPEYFPELGIDPANYPIEYYFKINSATNTYDIRLYNTVTGITHTANFNITPLEVYINTLAASTELYYPLGGIPPCNAYTTIRQDAVYLGSITQNPTDVFTPVIKMNSYPYVDVTYQQSGNKYYTYHNAGDTVS